MRPARDPVIYRNCRKDGVQLLLVLFNRTTPVIRLIDPVIGPVTTDEVDLEPSELLGMSAALIEAATTLAADNRPRIAV